MSNDHASISVRALPMFHFGFPNDKLGHLTGNSSCEGGQGQHSPKKVQAGLSKDNLHGEGHSSIISTSTTLAKIKQSIKLCVSGGNQV